MSRRIFVSYEFSERELAHTVHSFFQAHGGSCQGEAVFVTNDVSAGGEAAIDREIRRVMSTCQAAMFLVSDNAHNKPWIDREAELARSLNLPVVLVRLADSTGGVPNRFDKMRGMMVEWSSTDVCRALNQLKI